jgi:Xaa-Pro aminopeptidase
MNHDEWVRQELRELSKSLGFRYTPLQEIENRLTRIRTGMKKQEVEALFVVQKMNFYYLSGTTQDGLLFIPLEGKPLLMIKRELERTKVESPLRQIVALKSNREIPLLIQSHMGKLPNRLGLEMDVLPVKDYFKFQELFQNNKLMDAS